MAARATPDLNPGVTRVAHCATRANSALTGGDRLRGSAPEPPLLKRRRG
ncbi:hypothetical protein QF035_004577 [Streptomyces umbrinus]|uniref:Uncharacterized protein n=1 Tax=Streptomyces umbrinus TaxID=67370 RepID=A0ABU0STY4_9ACTN|nr:hypothetical protein [Streptomyces umbrinus]